MPGCLTPPAGRARYETAGTQPKLCASTGRWALGLLIHIIYHCNNKYDGITHAQHIKHNSSLSAALNNVM